MTSMKRSSNRQSVWRRFRVSRVGITVAVVTFLVLSGTGAYAYWNVSTGMKFTASVPTGTLVVDTSWSTTAAMEFTNEPASLKKLMYFTVENKTLNNSGARAYDAVLTFSGATVDPNPVKSNITLSIWKATSPTTGCGTTLPSGIPTKTWNDLPITLTGTLAPPGASGSKDMWCIYSAVEERSLLATGAGTAQLTPKITATLKAGSWTASSIKTTNLTGDGPVQKTKAIFRQKPWASGVRMIKGSNGMCLDVSRAAGAAKDVHVIQYPCYDSSNGHENQLWNATVVGSSGVDAKYVKFSPLSSTSVQLAGPSPITVQSAPTIGDGEEQQWQIQERSDGVYQLVNRETGLCLTRPDNTQGSQLTTKSCDADGPVMTYQQFTFGSPVAQTLTCHDQSSLFNKWDYNRYSWTTPTEAGATITIQGSTFNKPIPTGSTFFKIWEKGKNNEADEFYPGTNKTYTVLINNSAGETYLTGKLKASGPFLGVAGSWLDCE